MPIHLLNLKRRRFLKVAGANFFFYGQSTKAREHPVEQSDLVYLLNDTHIGEKQPSNSTVPSHLRQVVTEMINNRTRVKCVLINGDLALKDGQPGDYRHLAKIIQPLEQAGIDTHLTLGNHDHRKAFLNVFHDRRKNEQAVESRQIAIIETEHANFFLLDSLKKTMVTQGSLGKRQLTWLTQALDKFQSKPAIIVAHHNPRLGGDPLHFPGGLIDSQELWNVIAPRTWVKAYVHGHIHDRGYAEHQGIHILNMPATSYVADPKKSTTGWTTAKPTAHGITLTTHTTDSKHVWNGESKKLKWRAS